MPTTESTTKSMDEARVELLYKLRDTEIKEELVHYAKVMYGDKFNLYGLTPEELVQNKMSILGRTIIECCVTAHSKGIANELDAYLSQHFPKEQKFAFVDGFAGSLNVIYHICERYGNSHKYIAYEKDDKVFETTQKNLSLITQRLETMHGGPVDFQFFHGDTLELIGQQGFSSDYVVVTFVAPPWGAGFSFENGLDLSKTEPPTKNILL